MKKLFIISLIIFILAAGVGSYFYFKKPATSTPGSPNTTYNGNPFGTSGIATPDTTSVASTTADGRIIIPLQTLTHIYTDPVAGGTFVTAGTTTKIRFVDRGTAHVYDFDTSSGILTSITNTTIPEIQNAYWLNNGGTVVLQYLAEDDQTVSTYSAQLVLPGATATTISGSLQGKFLPNNITSLASNPAGKRVVFQATSGNGSQSVIANADGSKSASIFSSPITHWNVGWPSESTLTLTSGASSDATGFLYFMTQAGSLRKIIGGIRGLTTLTDPSTTYVAYTNYQNSLSILNTKTNTVVPTTLKTIAEKCVWGTTSKTTLYCAIPNSIGGGSYPDNWYQGVVGFSDSLYKIDVVKGTATKLVGFTETYNQTFDMTNLVLSAKEDQLTFMNKTDLSLWSLRLNQLATH
jgi:hypothetical protein